MDLTKEIIDEIANAFKELEFGEVIISISGQPDDKTIDITTKKRVRFRKNKASSGSEKGQYKKETA
jgi:hypothetical protein